MRPGPVPDGRQPLLDDVCDRLAVIADELADAAVDSLRRAVEGEEAEAAADERRITRARRAVEKALATLRPPSEEL